MAKKPVKIGDRTFPTKKAAEDICREILYGYSLGTVISDRGHHEFLSDLLRLHPDTDEKIGQGIGHFEIRRNPVYPKQRTLFVVRTDGAETDFSFLKCLTHTTQRKDVLIAMREAVSDQVMAVARAAFASGGPVICPVTGDVLPTITHAHVDHAEPTFDVMASTWVSGEGGWDSIAVVSADGMIGARFGTQVQRDRWVEYHRQYAKLRVVSVRANLSVLRRVDGL